MRSFKKQILIGIKAVIFLLFVFIGSNVVLMLEIPTYSQYTRLMMNDMYNTKEEVDIIFLGTSKVYSSVNPYIVEQETGKEAFNLASAGQKMIGSYYLLKEFLENIDNVPEYIILDVQPTTFNSASNKDTFENYIITDYMKKGLTYWDFFIHSNTPSYWFEAFSSAYHYRDLFNINEAKNRIKGKYYQKYLGYEYAGEYKGKGYRESLEVLPEDFTIDEIDAFTDDLENMNTSEWDYFDKIVQLCNEYGSELILITIPATDEVCRQIRNPDQVLMYYKNVAEKKGLRYYDFNLNKDYLKQKNDFTDFYDGGHMNATGAKKFTKIICSTLEAMENGNSKNNGDYFNNYKEWLGNKDGG